MKYFVCVLMFFMFPMFLHAQHDTLQVKNKEQAYFFILLDSPAVLFTMRQSNENCLSLYRLGVRKLNEITSPKVSMLLQLGTSALLFIPITHEEGHRSILTAEHIGATSCPYYNKHLAAYVNGVRDQELIALRDKKLPTYIRLHTAGLESDYAMLLREASLMHWGQEDLKVLWMEYVMRKISLTGYYCMGLFKYNAGLKEEGDELKRDIVGHDIYGAIRHLHRPDMDFKRYTEYDDLTSVEKKFVKRVGWRSLLNLIDPLLVLKKNFTISTKYRVNVALGYGMAPFGDYIDEHVWLSTKYFNSHFYLRQYENKSTWFPALGASFHDMNITKNLSLNTSVHGWLQPQGLRFTEISGKFGSAVDLVGRVC